MQDLRIAMVQMNCRVAEKERNLDKIARFTEEAAAQSVDIICFPELCVCGYNAGDPSTPEPEPLRVDSLHRLEEIAHDSGTTLLAGFLERDISGVVYNTQVTCGTEEAMVVADLCASSAEESRRNTTMFFRHFGRPEMYRRWEGEIS